MNELIKENECIDDLQCGGLMLIQSNDGFKFGIDAVLLSDFAKDAPSKRTIDLCTGTGIVAVLLSAKTKTPRIDALELQAEVCGMAQRSVEYNGIGDRVFVKQGDLRDAVRIYGKSCFDKVTVNPPYMKAGAGLVNGEARARMISRHEVCCTLEDVISASAALLMPKGRFFMVHRPSRLADIFCLMRQHGIEPKRLRFVHPSAGKAANLLLVEGIRFGGNELKLEEPLYVYNEDGTYTREIDRIYGRE